MTSRTQAATAFIKQATRAWDSRGPWEDTAKAGTLAEHDKGVLVGICADTWEDYDRAEREVVDYCRERVAAEGK